MTWERALPASIDAMRRFGSRAGGGPEAVAAEPGAEESAAVRLKSLRTKSGVFGGYDGAEAPARSMRTIVGPNFFAAKRFDDEEDEEASASSASSGVSGARSRLPTFFGRRGKRRGPSPAVSLPDLAAGTSGGAAAASRPVARGFEPRRKTGGEDLATAGLGAAVPLEDDEEAMRELSEALRSRPGSSAAEAGVGTKKRLATFLVPVEKPVEEEASLKTKESEGTELRKSRNAQEMVEVGAGPCPTFYNLLSRSLSSRFG